MGHLLSRAIKRLTQCNSGARNQLAGSDQTGAAAGQEQQTTPERAQDSGRPSSEAIPVGQSIDSAEYAAFKTAQSSLDKNNRNNSASSSHSAEQVEFVATAKDSDQAVGIEPDVAGDERAQSSPQVEEAVIKIQALVRGHLTRKALKDAHHQPVPINVLGQSQFDEESLRNRVSAPQSGSSSAVDNQQHQPSGNKLAHSRVPPLESISEDVESSNAAAPSTRAKRRLSSPKSRSANSSSGMSGESVESQSTSPSNEANASIDIHCDTPASASIDIMDHSDRPPAAIASVLHQPATTTGVEPAGGAATDRVEPPPPPETGSSINVELQNGPTRLGSSMSALLNDQVPTMNASSVPSTPPHINLALTTNSHSIDSAEAAAIRIQSAFRGYHTRKHSPYRRRSPGNVSSAPVTLINGATSNGQPKRSTLRQQNATILDDDELVGSQDHELTAECLDPETDGETEENRRSRLRHRADDGCSRDLPQAAPNRVPASASLDAPASTTTAPVADYDPVTLATELGETSPRPTVLSNITNRQVSTNAEPDQRSHDAALPAKSDQLTGANRARSLETDSSYLGAALSLNEDLTEGLSQASNVDDAQPVSPKRDSLGAALESVGDDFSANQEAVPREQAVRRQLEELDRVTDQLEAALDEATDHEALTYGDELATNELDKHPPGGAQQNLNELESDDVERRHPSGFVEESSRGSLDQTHEGALVASRSLEDQEAGSRDGQQLAHLDLPQARFEAISPDEAIGSGGSSPALVESHDGNSSDDGADSDQDQDGQPRDAETTRADNQQSGSGGNKSGKKRRNRRRGKK